jgi:hypothetical protein
VKHHNYSYIDVLERVADGVHVDVVARKSDEESRRNRSNNEPRAEESPKPPSSKR